jgi:hypothetical protein
MTRKHFIALAAALADCKPDSRKDAWFDNTGPEFQCAVDGWYDACWAVATTCRQFNGLFDLPRFMAACGAE